MTHTRGVQLPAEANNEQLDVTEFLQETDIPAHVIQRRGYASVIS
jgi:hypothetical protein